jgi:hypothetical protein
MLGSLDVVDAGSGPEALRPEWALDSEMASIAVAIRRQVIDGLSASQQEDYPDSAATDMKRRLAERLTSDYVDSGLLSQETVDLKLEVLSSGY